MKAMFIGSLRRFPPFIWEGLRALMAVGLPLIGVVGTGDVLDLEAWFASEIVTIQLSIGEPVHLTAGDFNKDSLPDLFLTAEGNRPDWFLGVPNPNHEIRFYLLPGREEGWGDPVLVGILPGQGLAFTLGLVSLHSGVDLDGDGNEDLATLLTFSLVPEPPAVPNKETFQTDLLIFWGDGNGGFIVEHTKDLDVGLLPPADIVAGDFNSDGLVDLAYSDPQNLALHILYNRGGRRFESPHIVPIIQEKDECTPLPAYLSVARLDETRGGDDIVVAGSCIFSHDCYRFFIRGLISCEEGRWELTPLVLAGPLRHEFQNTLGNLMARDFNEDGHADVLFTQLIFRGEQHEAMGIYLMTGDGRGGFGPPVFLKGMTQGGLLSVERDPHGGWEVIAFSSEINGVVVLHTTDGSFSTTSIPVKGYAVDGIVLNRAGAREIVVISSLDLKTEVTLLNIIRRKAS
ncbi:MAG: FG-GAP repeat domain-containing protein [Candidatus Bipolaricaulaceae bacterium]